MSPKKTGRRKSPRASLFARSMIAGWLIYILRCRDGSLYTGITNDLPKRLRTHAAGRASRYTRSRLPVTLVYSEPQKSKSVALKREAAIKKLTRAEKEKLFPRKPSRRM